MTITPPNASLDWRIEERIPWLDVTPAAGAGADGPAEVQVVAVGHSLRPGRFVGKIHVLYDGAVNSPVQIPVELELIEVDLINR